MDYVRELESYTADAPDFAMSGETLHAKRGARLTLLDRRLFLPVALLKLFKLWLFSSGTFGVTLLDWHAFIPA